MHSKTSVVGKKQRLSALCASCAVKAFPALPEIDWIAPLAEAYLRGYRPRAQTRGALRGCWFVSPAEQRGGGRCGFFVGYLLEEKGWEFLAPRPPECLVFAWVKPIGGAAHRRLVRQQSSLVRGVFEYIRWLTHRPPRFAFFEDELPALARHASMRDWPAAKHEHYSRNFFIETLAWLVRSGLVKKLAL